MILRVQILVLLVASLFEIGLGFGEDCSKRTPHTDPCKSELYLHCNGKTCVCNPGMFYDKQGKRCALRIASDCAENPELCPIDGPCKEVVYIPHISMSPPESILRKLIHLGKVGVAKRCTCRSGLDPNPSREQCVPFLLDGEPCSEELVKKYHKNCSSIRGMTCGSAGTCTCRASKVYDQEFQTCATKVGARCYPNTPCERNSVCSDSLVELTAELLQNPVTQSYYDRRGPGGQCVCVQGFTRTSEGRCLGTFRAACRHNAECNKEQFLTCVDGTCQCDAGTVELFSVGRSSNKCHLLPGSSCSPKKGPPCWKNYVCKSGRCECGDDFTNVSGECLVNHGGKCGLHDSCNYLQGLGCIESSCGCFDSSLKWNAKMKTCTAEEGGFCGKYNQTQIVEVENGNRTDPLFPSEPYFHAPPFYYIGCPDGFTCAVDLALGFGRCKACKKNSC